MKLQGTLKLRINNFGGLSVLVTRYKECSRVVPESCSYVFEDMIIFFNNLYLIEDMDIENLALDRRELLYYTIDCLRRMTDHYNCKVLLFTLDLIELILEQTRQLCRLRIVN